MKTEMDNVKHIISTFGQCLRLAVPTAGASALWLLKLMIPISLGVTLAHQYGVLDIIARWLNPLFSLLGLPGSSAVAFVSGATEPEFLGAEQKSDGSYSVAYGFKASLVLSDVSSLTMVMGDKAYSTKLFGADSIINWGNLNVYPDENGNIMFAIQIDGVDAEYITEETGTPDFALYVK